MSHSNLSLLSDDELLNHAHNAANSLTTTDLETEVLKRFEDGNNFSRYFDILEGFDDPSALQNRIDLAEDFRNLLIEFAEDDLEGLKESLRRLVNFEEILIKFNIKDSDDLEKALQSLEDARALLTTTIQA